MKTIYNYRGGLVLLLLAAVTILYSCSKSDEPSNTPTPTPVTPSGKTTPTDPVTEYTMTVNATMGEDDATSRALELDTENNIINSTWTEGDEVKVYKNQTEIGTLTAQELSNNNQTCVLKGTITGEVQNGDELTLQYRSNDFSSHNGTLTDLAAKCDYSTAAVIASVNGTKITTTADVEFINQRNIIRFTLKDKATDSTINPSSFTIKYGDNSITLSSIPEATYTTNGEGILFLAVPNFSEQNIILLATVGENIYRLDKNNVSFTDSRYYRINAGMSYPGAGVTNYVYDISGNDW